MRLATCKKLCIILLLFAYSFKSSAQLTVDPNFNPVDHGGGKHNGTFGGDWGVDLGLQLSNGKILVGGFFGFLHNQPNNGLSMLNGDCSVDLSFKAPGASDDMGDGVTTLAQQPDGKIIVGGYMSKYLGQTVHGLVRINLDGSIDTSFHAGTAFKEAIYQIPLSIVIQPDKKILIGGSFTDYNGAAVNCLIRLNSNGNLDTSFHFLSDSSTRIEKIILDASNKIIVGGIFKIHSNPKYKNLARLNADGSLDESFYAGSNINISRVFSFDVQNDNKVVFACDSSLYRVNQDGEIDKSFVIGVAKNSLDKYNNESKINDIKIEANGKIVVGGAITSYNKIAVKNILMLNTDGNIDNSFKTATGFGASSYGGSYYGTVESIALLNNGQIFIAGGFLFYQGVWQGSMAVLNSDGSLSKTFNADNGNGADANVNKIVVQPDNKILIAGYFSAFNGVSRNKIARLNADGTLDNTFNPGTGPDSCNFINTIALQKDGKIIVGGNFSQFSNQLKSYIVRLNNDGSIDNSFSFTNSKKTYGEVSDGVRAVAIQPDGKIIIGFETKDNIITGNYDKVILQRLNTDGSVDNSFNADTLNHLYGSVSSIKIQKDNKILVAGNFDITYSNELGLIRLNNDGSVDKTFNNGVAGFDGSLTAVDIQSNGKIMITGYFDTYNNTPTNILARLNVDGTLDETYTPIFPDVETDVNYLTQPYLIVDDNDNTIFSYLYVSDSLYGRVLRISTNGKLDSSFGINNKTDFFVNDMAIQNNKLLLSGFIESFNGIKRNHITRIITPEILPVTLLCFTAQKQNSISLLQWQTANEINNDYFNVERSANSRNFTNIGKVNALNCSNKNNYSFVDNTPLQGTNYYRLKQFDKDGKFVYSKIVSVEFNSNGAFAVSPNPADNQINITIPIINSTSQLTVFDISGKKALNEQIAANINSKQINISSLPAGVYNVVLLQNGKQQSVKVIKK